LSGSEIVNLYAKEQPRPYIWGEIVQQRQVRVEVSSKNEEVNTFLNRKIQTNEHPINYLQGQVPFQLQ
jgi:hypothetical protein